VAGALITAKSGSTVPLKFNVYDNAGIEVTNPSTIAINTPEAFPVKRIGCETGEPEDAVPFETTGGTAPALRHDNPPVRPELEDAENSRACYLVQVTGDGLLLSARFKLR
jgi:hypothetical protein